MGKLSGKGQGRRRRLKQVKRAAEEVDGLLGYTGIPRGGREVKRGAHDTTRSFRRFVQGTKQLEEEERKEGIELTGKVTLPPGRRKGRQEVGEVDIAAKWAEKRRETLQSYITGLGKEEEQRKKRQMERAEAEAAGPSMEQATRTNRQVKRRAFEKRRKEKKRAKRLRIPMDVGDDDGGEDMGDIGEAEEDYRERDDRPSFGEVAHQPPSFALKLRGSKAERKSSLADVFQRQLNGAKAKNWKR